MKKWIAMLLLIGLLAAVMPMAASASSGSCGDSVTWNLSADGVLTISGTGEMAQYAQPEDVPWFSQRAFVYKAVVEEGITALAPYCFYQCTYMTEISLPESLTEIGAMALESCCMLTELRLGEKVTDIGMSAFYDCSELISVYIPGKITSIGFGSFFNCRKLENVYIEDLASWCQTSFNGMNTNPLSIAPNLYVGGQLVTDLVIPEGTAYVATSAFFGWKGVQSVKLPDSVREIRTRAFYGCSNLRSVTFGSGVEKLGEKAFRDCAAMENLTFTGNMPSFHKDAFQNVTAAAYYPAGNSTWKNPGQYGGTLTWSDEAVHTHSYTAHITVPTCTADGHTAYTCACGDSYTSDEIPATGHSWGQWVQTVKPDETRDGVDTRVCTACGETETKVVDNNIFTDVKKDRFEAAILWAYYNNITTGTGDGTTFSPENACTRKQIVTFLWRAAGEPEPESMVNPFKDVKSDRFEKAILWAYYAGITAGTGDGSTFSPENTCTRKQIVTFLWRYNGQPAPKSMENKFVDVKNDRFTAAILWAAEQGITTGTGDGTTFSPEDPCTRKQIVTFLFRNLNK